MHIIDDLKMGFQVMLRPGETTKKSMEIGQAYSFYYKATLLPLVALIIISLIIAGALAASPLGSLFGGLLGSVGLATAVVVPILAVWILIPISILINGGLYHLFGMWTGQFKQDFNKTLTATMFSKMPTTIFLFALVVPATIALFPLFVIWELVVLVIALSNQQKVKWNVAFGVVVITVTVIAALVGLILTVFAISISGAMMGWLNAVVPHLLGNGGLPTITIPI
ncbi:MAG: hypothetical protein LVQ95_00395 [Candidatus Micrarchaeales archaeon]|nr:hypothetical protein [Candidatus Micrarchaeales archaeon]